MCGGGAGEIAQWVKSSLGKCESIQIPRPCGKGPGMESHGHMVGTPVGRRLDESVGHCYSAQPSLLRDIRWAVLRRKDS